MSWEAFGLSIKLASTTSFILLLIALPLAYWIAYSKWRWKFLVEAVVALPIVLPPTVLGFYLLIAMGTRSFFGRIYQEVFGSNLVFSFEGLVIASVFYSLPFAVQPLSAAFLSVDKRLIQLSAVLGAAPLVTFIKVILPLSTRGILMALILSFAHTIGEFGVVLMVGGNIAGETRTISIDLYDQVQAMNDGAALETALFLLMLSFFFLSLVYFIDRKKGRTIAGPKI